MRTTRSNLYSMALLIAVATLCGWLSPDSTTNAQEKPLLVLSVAKIDDLLEDGGYLAEAAGFPEYLNLLKQIPEMNPGLDATRPTGAVITTDGTQLKPLGFVPITKSGTWRDSAPPDVARDVGDGVLQLQVRQMVSVFVKEQGEWVFAGRDPEMLKDLPAQPAQQLEGLDQEYDVAIRVHVPNIPEPYRQLALSQMKAVVQLQQQGGAQSELQTALLENQIRQWEALITEVDQVTIGLNVDRQSNNAYLDMTVTALEGTKTAKQMAALTDTKSAFSGLLRPDAAVTLNVSSKITEEDIQQTVAMMDGLRENAKRQIDQDQGLPDQQARSVAKGMVDELFDLAKKTVATGRMDGAAAVLLSPGSITALAGAYVADGSELESSLKKLIELAKKDPEFPGVQLNADEHAGVRFHTMSVDVPPDEDVRKIIGDRLDVAVGIGPKSVFLSVGKDGVSQLKKAIDESATEKIVAPFEMKLALGRILRFAASAANSPKVAGLADVLEQSQGKDHILISGKPVKNGATYRFLVEEGVVKGIGHAIKAARGGGL